MKKIIIMAGPCVIESEELLMEVSEEFHRVISKYENIDFYFKSSFDKANRTSINSYRGPGIKKGLEYLEKIKKKYGFKIVTDIHEPFQAEIVAKIADVIQIPAFLCRQTDLLVAAAKTSKIVNVKKAQFLSANDMTNVVNKLKQANAKKIFLTERGSMFGYNNLVVDYRNIIEMKKTGNIVIFDATHSVQRPGGDGASTGGNREYVRKLALAAITAGADGIFFETHPNPELAMSDGPNMLYLREFESFIKDLVELFKYTESR